MTDIQIEDIWTRMASTRDLINPLSEEKAAELLGWARLGSAPRVLDVGCGTGAWSRFLKEAHPDSEYLGVDVSAKLIDQARKMAREHGLEDRTTFEVADGTTYRPPGRFDLIILMGLPGVFGSVEEQLNMFRDMLTQNGVMIFGDGIWTKPPPETALALMQEEADAQFSFKEMVTQVLDAGWLPVIGHESTEQEWDAFQWACVDALARWGLDEGATHMDPLIHAYSHISYWLHGYRNYMGFATFVLRPMPQLCRVLGPAQYHAIHESSLQS